MARGKKSRLTSNYRKQEKNQEKLANRRLQQELLKAPKEVPVETSHVPDNQERLETCLRNDEQLKLEAIFQTSLSEIPFLHGVCALGKFELAKRILRTGPIDIDAQGPGGGTPLLWAVRGGRSDLVALLRGRGASLDAEDDIGDCPMTALAEQGEFEEHTVLSLFREAPRPEELVTSQGNTLIHLSVKRDWSGLLDSSIAAGINVDQVNNAKETPLIICAALDRLALATRLLQSGAGPHFRDDRGCTALCYALANAGGRPRIPKCELVELLMNVTRKTQGKRTVQEHVDGLMNNIRNPPFPIDSAEQLDTVLGVAASNIVYLGVHHSKEWNHAKALTELYRAMVYFKSDEEYCAAIAQVLLEVILIGDVRSEDEVEHSAKENQIAVEFMSNPENAANCLQLAESFLGEDFDAETEEIELEVKTMSKHLADKVSTGVTERWLPASWALMLPMLCACATCCIGRSWLMQNHKRVTKVFKHLHPDQLKSVGGRRAQVLRRVYECKRLMSTTRSHEAEHNAMPHRKTVLQHQIQDSFSTNQTVPTSSPAPKDSMNRIKVPRLAPPKPLKEKKSENKGKKKGRTIKESDLKREINCKSKKEQDNVALKDGGREQVQNYQLPEPEFDQEVQTHWYSDECYPKLPVGPDPNDEQEKAPTVARLRNMFMSLAKKYERLWESDRRAGYPGFLDREDSPLGETREEQLHVLRSIERQYLHQMRKHWIAVENSLLKLSPQRYDYEARKILRVINNHTMRNQEHDLVQENVDRWKVVENCLRNEELVNLGASGPRVCTTKTVEGFLKAAIGSFGELKFGVVKNGVVALKLLPFDNATSVIKSLKSVGPLRSKFLISSRFVQFSPYEAMYMTPLCEYNLEEYMNVIKKGESIFGIEVLIRQIVLGLESLHTHEPPIVHGNLKPSNILIDARGKARLAEFGLYEDFQYRTIAEKTPGIWTARENLINFRLTRIIKCSSEADIQVLGMIIHFVASHGSHPFGSQPEEIETSIIAGTPHLQIPCCDLRDLLCWLLNPEPDHRPYIDSVLSHIYFWNPEKRWQFLMMCAGLPSHKNNGEMKRNKFHEDLSYRAETDGIKADWYSIIRRDFLKIPGPCLRKKCPISLLKFIAACTKAKPNDLMIQNYFITQFPALPLAIYQLLERTDWITDRPFSQFIEKY